MQPGVWKGIRSTARPTQEPAELACVSLPQMLFDEGCPGYMALKVFDSQRFSGFKSKRIF